MVGKECILDSKYCQICMLYIIKLLTSEINQFYVRNKMLLTSQHEFERGHFLFLLDAPLWTNQRPSLSLNSSGWNELELP